MPRLLEGVALLPGKAAMPCPLSAPTLAQRQPRLSLGTSFSSSLRLSLVCEELGEGRAGVVLSGPSPASQAPSASSPSLSRTS